ncbi:MAG: glycosyltransferase family 2 protein [Succinivibrionaceae bacterium]|nr:glycosyltransferase family 2 protein [Succinivibrionaceae bacterium]
MALDLGVIILCRNEEGLLGDCIRSLGDLPSQVLVVDNGSTDRSPEIARELGAQVIGLPGVHGFGPRRRAAQDHLKTRFALHLDADERLTAGCREEIKRALAGARDHDIFLIPRRTFLMGQEIRHCGWYPDYVERLYTRSYTKYSDAEVHERLLVPGDACCHRLGEPLLHYSYRSLEQYFGKQCQYALLYAEKKGREGKRPLPLWLLPLAIAFAFLKMYVLKLGFLDGRAGLWLSISFCAYQANKYLARDMAAQGRQLRR